MTYCIYPIEFNLWLTFIIIAFTGYALGMITARWFSWYNEDGFK